eukprot:TRINITY_DN111633_c0_g1_i1.p1 TRINITY_DN111633_c0_g1~~TRINITY_DN111633_c0_g1_i1.p1  ORF type:complete len:636 (+),score=79.48 TRINITY_DN111633_c0_g1_i1:153-2060(+)
MSFNCTVLPAWPIAPSQDGNRGRLRADTCETLQTCTTTVDTRAGSLSPLSINSCGGSCEMKDTLHKVVDDVHADLGQMMKSMCDDMQNIFSREVKGRLKTLEHELDLYVEQQLQEQGGVAETACGGQSPRKFPLCSNAGTKTKRRTRKPIELPKAELQAATMESDMREGRLHAQEAVLAAGFLGGSGRLMQCLWFGLATIFALWPLISEDTSPWHVGACGLACSFMRFLSKIRCFLLSISAFTRTYFLRAQDHARAHWALLACVIAWLATGFVLHALTLYLSWALDCEWREEAFLLHAAGSACSPLSILDSTIQLAILLPISGMVWTLWRMRLKDASRLFQLAAALYVCQQGLFILSYMYFASKSVVKLVNIGIGAMLSLIVIVVIQLRRNASKKRAWRVVEKDAESYQDLWVEIAEKHSESIQSLAQVSKQVAADIDVAAVEGPQHHLCEAENQRRKLLTHHRRMSGELRQSLPSLPLLFAQACAVDAHFQSKCAEWAGGAGTHMPGLIKQPSRAVQKVWRSYHGNEQSLVDLVRSSIVCETPEHLLTVLRDILADNSVRILRIKNRFDPRFDSRLSGGYRNLSLNVIIFDSDSLSACAERHICEVQLALREINALKTAGGHQRFVAFRDDRAE